jgi:hypothetical protein
MRALHSRQEARVLKLDSSARSSLAGVVWFAVAALASVVGSALGRLAGAHTMDPAFPARLLGTCMLASFVVAGSSIWRMVRCRADSWLLPLAALNLALLEPGRAGDATTWRAEWAVGGVAATAAAVALFGRLLARTDELQRRIYIDGAALGLLMALPLAMAYALFESWLPELRAQWVTISLLLLWWAGWLLTSFRYRYGTTP